MKKNSNQVNKHSLDRLHQPGEIIDVYKLNEMDDCKTKLIQ